jgi:hypothetical protein
MDRTGADFEPVAASEPAGETKMPKASSMTQDAS